MSLCFQTCLRKLCQVYATTGCLKRSKTSYDTQKLYKLKVTNSVSSQLHLPKHFMQNYAC